MRPRYAMFGGRLSLSGGVCDLLDKCHKYLYSRSVGEPFDIGIGPGSVIAAILMASSLLS